MSTDGDGGRDGQRARRGWGLKLVLAGLPAAALGVGGCQNAPSQRPGWAHTGEGEVARAALPGIIGEPDMRVRLGSGVSVVQVGASVGESVWVAPAASRTRPARMRTPVSVRLTESRWELTDGAGLMGVFERSEDLVVSPADGVGGGGGGGTDLPTGGGARSSSAARMPVSAAALTLNGAKYPGMLRLATRSDVSPRAFDIIEEVAMEEYLKGVVSAELPGTWPVGAFRAQAVAARSYAIHERARARQQSRAFDVEASVADQAYKGASELPQAVQAVRETRGVVLTWRGDVLRAYYSSTAGGRAASARDTWPSGTGYEFNLAGPLQATSREFASDASPLNRWTVIRPRAELTQRLRAWGRTNGHPVKAITAIDTIKVLSTNEVGRPTKYLVLQPGGQSYTLTAESIRVACNTEVPGLPAIGRAARVNSGDFEASVEGDTVRIQGRGFGHGVGMCQYSAKGLAEKGWAWQKIVANFYPGAELKKAY